MSVVLILDPLMGLQAAGLKKPVAAVWRVLRGYLSLPFIDLDEGVALTSIRDHRFSAW